MYSLPPCILYLVLDFGGAIPVDQLNKDGFYPIAWGFIRVNSSAGGLNIGPEKNLKLQLYKYLPKEISAISRYYQPTIHLL